MQQQAPSARYTLAVEHDEATLVACRAGDRAALGRVLGAELPRVEGLLRRILGPTADLEDVAQATLENAIRAFPRFRGEAKVSTWLARIAVRTAMAHIRRGATRTLSGASEADFERHASADDPGARAESRERLVAFYRHLEKVPAKQRAAFVLHVLEGRPMQEVAALIDAGVSTTKSRVFWARRTLMRSMGRDPQTREWLAEYVGEATS